MSSQAINDQQRLRILGRSRHEIVCTMPCYRALTTEPTRQAHEHSMTAISSGLGGREGAAGAVPASLSGSKIRRGGAHTGLAGIAGRAGLMWPWRVPRGSDALACVAARASTQKPGGRLNAWSLMRLKTSEVINWAPC